MAASRATPRVPACGFGSHHWRAVDSDGGQRFVTVDGWDEYLAAAGDATLNRQAIELYRRWWDLADIAIFVDLLRRQHDRTEDTVASWEALAGTLAAV